MNKAWAESWKTDWSQFIHCVAADFERGMSARQVTEKYRDQVVEWVGKGGTEKGSELFNKSF